MPSASLDQRQAARVERGHRVVVHLVGRHLHHLVFEVDRVAAGPHLVADVAVGRRNASRCAVAGMWSGSVRASVSEAAGSARSKFGGARSRGRYWACRRWRRSRPERAGAPGATACACAASKGSECRKSASACSSPSCSHWADFAGRMVNGRLNAVPRPVLPLIRRLP